MPPRRTRPAPTRRPNAVCSICCRRRNNQCADILREADVVAEFLGVIEQTVQIKIRGFRALISRLLRTQPQSSFYMSIRLPRSLKVWKSGPEPFDELFFGLSRMDG